MLWSLFVCSFCCCGFFRGGGGLFFVDFFVAGWLVFGVFLEKNANAKSSVSFRSLLLKQLLILFFLG